MPRFNPAMRRYLLRFGVSMGAYVACIAVAGQVFSHTPPHGVARYGLALAPALCVMGVIWAMGRYLVEEPDEYLRMRLARAALWATGITLSVCTAWGFLQTYAGVEQAPLYAVFVVYCAALGLVQGLDKIVGRA